MALKPEKPPPEVEKRVDKERLRRVSMSLNSK